MSTAQIPAQSGSDGRHRVSIPSWLISMVVHGAVLGCLTVLTWSVSRSIPEKEFTVGIMIRKDAPEGEVYQDQTNTYEAPDNLETPEPQFLPDDAGDSPDLPELPNLDTTALGVSGTVGDVGEMLQMPGADVGQYLSSTRFFNVQAKGNSFVYVIDRSGSMRQRDAWGAAKRELLKSLDQLPSSTKFQIILYNFDPLIMSTGGKRSQLINASKQNKVLAKRFLDRWSPDGGTEHVPPLELALKLKPEVVLFLTDADDMEMTDVVRVKHANEHKAIIHAIEFGYGPELSPYSPQKNVALRNLATENGGTYRYVDVGQLGSQ